MRNVDSEEGCVEIIAVPDRSLGSLDETKMQDDKTTRFGTLVKDLKCKNAILRKRNCVLKIQKKSLVERCENFKQELEDLRKKYGGMKEQCAGSPAICVHKDLLQDALMEILHIKKIISNLKPENMEENVPSETQNVEQPPVVNGASNDIYIELDTTDVTIEPHDIPQVTQVITETVPQKEIPIENESRDKISIVPGTSKELRVVLSRLVLDEHVIKKVGNSTNKKVRDSTNGNSTNKKVDNSPNKEVDNSCDPLDQTTNSNKRKLPNDFPSDRKTWPNKHDAKPNLPKHDEPRAFKCMVISCGKEFTSKGWFRKHLTTHKRIPNLDFDLIQRQQHKCTVDGCGQSFVVKHDLFRHLSEHAKEKPFRCSFDGCSLKFSRNEDLQVHIEEHDQVDDQVHDEDDTGEKPLVCSFDGCDQRFTNVDDREAHINTHTIKKPFKCPFIGCRLRFSDREDCRLHRRIHTYDADKPFQCSFYGCGRNFTTESKLEIHARLHVQEKRFKCPFKGCERKYTSEYTLEDHCSKHPGFYLYNCRLDSCKGRFCKRSGFNKHMLHHQKVTDEINIKKDVKKVLDDILDKLIQSCGENAIGSDIN